MLTAGYRVDRNVRVLDAVALEESGLPVPISGDLMRRWSNEPVTDAALLAGAA